jgi:hypothetical protein
LFSPIGGGASASADIQPDGTFLLADGAKIGQHRVTVLGPRPAQENEPRLTFTPPDNFTIDVKADAENNVSLDMRKADGWRIEADD